MALSVWADAPDVPNRVCINARLRGANTHPANPDGQTYGQGNWDIGIHFINLSDLARQLTRLLSQTPAHMCASPSAGSWSCNSQRFCPGVGQVTRLAINAHGVPGTVYTGGTPSPFLQPDPEKEKLAISAENMPNITGDLKRIYYATAPNATILFMGCLAGRVSSGTELLKALAPIWPQRKIVAFETVGFQSPSDMQRPGEKCSEPGMRDTGSVYSTQRGAAVRPFAKDWDRLIAMPWASETSPGAKVMENGVITKALTEQF